MSVQKELTLKYTQVTEAFAALMNEDKAQNTVNHGIGGSSGCWLTRGWGVGGGGCQTTDDNMW